MTGTTLTADDSSRNTTHTFIVDSLLQIAWKPQRSDWDRNNNKPAKGTCAVRHPQSNILVAISPQWLHCMTRACGWPMMVVERRKGYQPAACFSKSKTTACPDFSAKSNAVNPFESWTMWEAPDAKSTSTFWACPYSDEMWSAVLLSARCPHWAFTLAPALIRRGKHLEFCVIAAAWIGARPHESTLSMRSRWSCSKSTNRSSLSHRAAWRGRRAMIVGLWGSIKLVSSRKSAHLMQQPSGKVLTLRGAIHCSNGDGYCGPGHIRATLKPPTQIANHCDWILKTNCTWACKQTVWQLWVGVATSLHLFTIVVILCSFASPIRFRFSITPLSARESKQCRIKNVESGVKTWVTVILSSRQCGWRVLAEDCSEKEWIYSVHCH